MKTHQTLIFLLLLAISISACKKYEDGPVVSLRSVKKRLQGTWKATKQVENGYEYLNDFRITFDQLDDSKDPEGLYNTYTLYTSDSSNAEEKYYGTWEVSDDKKHIFLYGSSMDYNIGNGWNTIYWKNYTLTWDILRLTMEEMWIESKYKEFEHYFEFEKI